MLAALPLLASLVSAPSTLPPHAAVGQSPADPAAIVGEILTSADHILAVHELPGAVAFDLLDHGRRWQLTVAIDDDGVVVDTALAAVGPAHEPTRSPTAQARRVSLARVERIDHASAGRVRLRGGGRHRALTVTGEA